MGQSISSLSIWRGVRGEGRDLILSCIMERVILLEFGHTIESNFLGELASTKALNMSIDRSLVPGPNPRKSSIHFESEMHHELSTWQI